MFTLVWFRRRSCAGSDIEIFASVKMAGMRRYRFIFALAAVAAPAVLPERPAGCRVEKRSEWVSLLIDWS